MGLSLTIFFVSSILICYLHIIFYYRFVVTCCFFGCVYLATLLLLFVFSFLACTDIVRYLFYFFLLCCHIIIIIIFLRSSAYYSFIATLLQFLFSFWAGVYQKQPHYPTKVELRARFILSSLDFTCGMTLGILLLITLVGCWNKKNCSHT